MKLKKYYSHLNGYEWIQSHKNYLWKEIEDVIEAIDASKFKTKIGREKGNKGKNLYSPEKLNKEFDKQFLSKGWNRQKREDFYCSDDPEINKQLLKMDFSDQIKFKKDNPNLNLINSYNAKDFDKEKVAIEIQMGKYSFVQFDIFIKHAADYMAGKIEVGVEIVPMKSMEKEMSSGPPYYEKHLHEILRQGRIFPPVPIVLIGIEP
tara:strand:- start:1699 stop:2316 length:618 start_codon:yes stop_codon:yes gene_type:complete